METIIEQIKNLLDELNKQYNFSLKNSSGINNKIILNDSTFEVILNEKKVKLTHNQFVAFKYLFLSENKFATYEQLCLALYNYPYDKETEVSLKTTIHRLRCRINGICKIKTIREKGYQLLGV